MGEQLEYHINIITIVILIYTLQKWDKESVFFGFWICRICNF